MRSDGRHLDSAEVMERFSICKTTLYNWMKSKTLGFPKPTRINGRNYFPVASIEAWEREMGKPVGEPDRVLGCDVVSDVIQSYEDLVAAMIDRRKALKLSNMELENKAGFQEGYVTKLENPGKKYGRGVGPDTLPLWLGGLRVGIVLVDLPRRPRKVGLQDIPYQRSRAVSGL